MEGGSYIDQSISRVGVKPPITSVLMDDHLDPETTNTVPKGTKGLSDFTHMMANEPSVALYRVREHVQRSLPTITDRKKEMKTMVQRVEGVVFDLTYTTRVIDELKLLTIFDTITRQVQYSINLKQAIDSKKPAGMTTISHFEDFKSLHKQFTTDAIKNIFDSNEPLINQTTIGFGVEESKKSQKETQNGAESLNSETSMPITKEKELQKGNTKESLKEKDNELEDNAEARISMDNEESDNEEQTDTNLNSNSNSSSNLNSKSGSKDGASRSKQAPKNQSMNSLKKIAKTKINTTQTTQTSTSKKASQTADLKPKKF